MAKAKTKAGGVRLPKSVAGVKLPKELRRKANKLIAKANSPEGREALAAGLTIAGAALAATAQAKAAAQAQSEPRRRTRPAAEPDTPPPPGRPGTAGIAPGQELGDVIAAGIGALQKFLR